MKKSRLFFVLLIIAILVSVFAGCGKEKAGGNDDNGEDPGPITRHLEYFDDFSDPTSGWPNETGYSREMSYEDGEYMIRLSDSYEMTRYVVTKHWLLNEYEVSVKATYRRGWGLSDIEQPIYGLRFNCTGTLMADQHKFYTFGLYPENQWFVIARFVDRSEWDELVPVISKQSDHIKAAMDEWNELKVKVDHGQAWFYINEHLVHGPLPIIIQPEGVMVGILASNDRNYCNGKCTDVRFDDFHLIGTELLNPKPIP